MSAGIQVPWNFPPVAPEDLVELGIEPQLIPFIVSASLQNEQSPNGSPPLGQSEVENLVDILDKVVSSAAMNPSSRNRCFRVLHNVSSTHGVLPKSYFPSGVTLSDTYHHTRRGFAEVWKGQLDGNQICVKVFRAQTPANLDKIKRRFYRDIVGWKYVSHPNVLPFLGVSETLFEFCIINPWMPNGNIIEYIQRYQSVDRLQLLAQAACGLEYLHSLNIEHGDINPGNILIDGNGVVHLGDFGIIGIVTDSTVVERGGPTTSKPGVVRYAAPELLNPSQFHLASSNPSKESDVYSLAMTAYEILTGILPFGIACDNIVISHVVAGDRPSRPKRARWLQDNVWNMITTCWSEDREQRWDVHGVYNQFLKSSIKGETVAQESGYTRRLEQVSSPRILQADVDECSRHIAPEGLAEPDVKPQLISIIVSMALWAEQLPNGSLPFSQAEAETLVEEFDQVVSSTATNPCLKDRCLRVLRNVSSTHGVLPKSYFPPGVTLSDTIAHASDGVADTWKGRQDKSQVRIKAFQTQNPASVDRIKRKFYRDIVGWKYISHPNVLSFLGVSETLFKFCIISPWMPNGNITEYIKRRRRVNRLQLLAQAACGLEYLHSLNIVHGDINPGNILITQEGNSCIGDFGITGIITDPTVVEQGSMIASSPGAVRYMAPELLNPSQFDLANSNPSKESDIYSLAMTAYQILTGILPYGNNRGGVIAFQVVTGDRPTRPADTRWLRDQIWNMITACWSGEREERRDIHVVYTQFSTSSIHEGPDIEPEVEITRAPLKAVAIAPKDLSPVPLSLKLKEPDHTVRQDAEIKSPKLRKEPRSQSTPVLDTPGRKAPKKDLVLPSSFRSGGVTSELSTDLDVTHDKCSSLTVDAKWSQPAKILPQAVSLFQLAQPQQPEIETSINLALGDSAMSNRERMRLINKLCKACSQQRLLPRSMHISDSLNESSEVVRYGSNADVLKGTYKGRQVAVKVLRLYILGDFDVTLGRFCREAVIWRHLTHPNILPLLGVTSNKFQFAMISEWMENGNINEFIQRDRRANGTELLADVANGLMYMHSLRLAHGDLKGANVLVDQDRRACVADFGLSTITRARVHRPATRDSDAASFSSFLSDDTLMSFTSGGSTRWTSPELLDPERFGVPESEGDRPTTQSDCYALGMVIYEVLCGCVPYHDLVREAVVMGAIVEGGRPSKPENAARLGFTEELWKIIEQCWSEDRDARPGVEIVHSRLNDATPFWNTREEVMV